MTDRRKVEIYSAGCTVCHEAIELVKSLACDSCEVSVHEMSNMDVAKRAKALGIHSLPAVVVNGQLAECCVGGGINEAALRQAGVGSAL